jgi:ABC-type antimicrobial peptide transport system permease subunit
MKFIQSLIISLRSFLTRRTPQLHRLEENLHTDIYVSDIINLTTQRLKSRRYRTLLTILGVGIGIGVVYVLVALTFGLQKLVIGNIATSETLLSLDVIPNTEIKDVVTIDEAHLNDISNLDSVIEVSPAKSLPAEIVYNDVKSQTLTYGVEPRYFALSNINADYGELFTDGDQKLVVSSSVLTLFGLNQEDAIGARVRLSFLLPNTFLGDTNTASTVVDLTELETATAAATNTNLVSSDVVEIPEQFEIVGVVQDDNNFLYLPLKYFDLVELNEYHTVKVKVDSQDAIESVREQILTMGFLVSALTDTLDQINSIFSATQITFTVVGITALFIAAIGMMNTMTVSLLERTREIGIMKAIGATNKGIRQMFLAESIIMGVGGGLGGLTIGAVLTGILDLGVRLLALSMGGKPVDVFYTPFWFYLLVAGFSLGIGLFTGLFPARRAASLNPLDALRYE